MSNEAYTKTNQMKQLFINGNATTLFFIHSVDLDLLCEWVSDQLFAENNIFGLEDCNSCNAHVSFNNNVVISGDDDRKELTLENIIPINLF